jgi:hypothetical protein
MDNTPKSGGFVARLLASKPAGQHVYCLIYDAPAGKEYFFMLVEPDKDLAFQQAYKGTAPFRLEDFGMVIKRGPGEPSQQEQDEIAAVYDMEFG